MTKMWKYGKKLLVLLKYDLLVAYWGFEIFIHINFVFEIKSFTVKPIFAAIVQFTCPEIFLSEVTEFQIN
jgi:hypothetical protein